MEGFLDAQRLVLRAAPLTCRAADPRIRLRIQIVQTREAAAGEEGIADKTHGPLDAAFQMSSRLHVMQSMGKKSFRSPIPSTPSLDASSF